jgi:PHP family Zn ribbon phosphoesterase
MRRYVADLHVHTVLSPCAAVEMTPRNIVWHAAQHGVDIVAITDHNACDNVPAAMAAAKDTDVIVLPGMEVETKEEVHLLALFAKPRQLFAWEKVVDAHRSGRRNDADRLGAQFVVDAEDNLLAVKEEMLLTSLSLSITETCAQVNALGGLVIASHVDRPAYGLLSQLGFIPPGLALAAVEVSRRVSPAEAAQRFPAIGDLPVVTASDAHTIEDFLSGPKMAFELEEPTLAEIRRALNNKNLRGVVLLPPG